jgi:hypothetical protein
MNRPAEKIEAADRSIRETIRDARVLFSAWRDVLTGDPGVRDLLSRAERCVEASRVVMLHGGLVNACRWCEEEAGGSCCGAGIENRYKSHLLLINLLMGVALPDRRACLESCYFLGKQGCSLKVRHVLCVNYLCERLRRDLDPSVVRDLQHCNGIELDTVFALHEAVKKITRA